MLLNVTNTFTDDTAITTVVPSVNSKSIIVDSLNVDLHEVELWAEK